MNQKNLSEMTVGDIVAENYNAAGVLKEYGIDFCCGGGLPLATACEKNGADVDQVTFKIVNLTDERNSNHKFTAWEPDFLIDYIINNHHSYVRKKVDEISAYAAKVAKVHGERYPENIEIYQHFITLANEMIEHLESEELRVFPLIKNIHERLKSGETPDEELIKKLKKELELMEDEHETAGDLMKAIHELSNGFTPPADACATYQILYQNLKGFEEDLHRHVHLENNILFKKAERFIPAA
ncbi:iron-sulfur cluster repair di-iron protein [Rhodohalobacter halophilus]|uniref:iron-sulfur cluster repair di-iron protein n=1 Tax=Rhodohalobacter halophilus TaxID=1812810 RepID=UPI00083F7D40|nr:iron-sulfur cluster repair di-iron protein [Rhodohalobacter halophilus]